MKIFEFDYGSAKDWVVARDEEEAAQELKSFTGSTEWEKVRVLKESELDHGGIVDADEYYDDDDIPDGDEDLFLNGHRLIKTWRKAIEEAEKNNEAEFLASTDW